MLMKVFNLAYPVMQNTCATANLLHDCNVNNWLSHDKIKKIVGIITMTARQSRHSKLRHFVIYRVHSVRQLGLP